MNTKCPFLECSHFAANGWPNAHPGPANWVFKPARVPTCVLPTYRFAHSFSGPSFTAGPGNHPVARGDGTSSIRIPPGYSVIMYDNLFFAGKAKLLTESVQCLRNLDDTDFENQVESYKISSGEQDTRLHNVFTVLRGFCPALFVRRT